MVGIHFLKEGGIIIPKPNPIHVIVYYPHTAEGKKLLEKAIAQDHAERVFRTIDRLKWPKESKKRFMDTVIERLKVNIKK